MKTGLVLFVLLLAVACTHPTAGVPQSAEEIKPLQVGEFIPDIMLRTPEDTQVNLMPVVQEKPTVIIFYRGGWCPYCNRHLSAMQQTEDELLALGFQILAISPDRPEKLSETIGKDHLTYQLLSDSSMEAARAFGIAFQIDDPTVKKYKEEYKIDIEADSGQTHHQLPVPAVFIVDRGGKVLFAYTNPDYKVRLSPDDLIRVARMVQ